MDAHRLHAVQVVDDRQPVEAEAAVLEVVDVLDAERVRAAVRDRRAAVALARHVRLAPEYRPYAAHVCADRSGSNVIKLF